MSRGKKAYPGAKNLSITLHHRSEYSYLELRDFTTIKAPSPSSIVSNHVATKALRNGRHVTTSTVLLCSA